MLTKSSQVEGVVGRPVTVSCEASGVPAPKYEFHKVGVHHAQFAVISSFLGRLLRVDLIKPASMSVRPYVRPSVRKKVSPIQMKFGL